LRPNEDFGPGFLDLDLKLRQLGPEGAEPVESQAPGDMVAILAQSSAVVLRRGHAVVAEARRFGQGANSRAGINRPTR